MSKSFLFGDGDWECPWYQYDAGVVKEVSQDALDFLQQTIGLHGTFHDQHGFIVDFKHWDAMLRYVDWCEQEKTDVLFHLDQIAQGSLYYKELATTKMESFMKAAEAAKR